MVRWTRRFDGTGLTYLLPHRRSLLDATGRPGVMSRQATETQSHGWRRGTGRL